MAPADLDVVVRVAGDLGELARRRGLDDLASHAEREADALALDVGAGVAEESEGYLVAAELEADLLEDRVRVVLEGREALLGEGTEDIATGIEDPALGVAKGSGLGLGRIRAR